MMAWINQFVVISGYANEVCTADLLLKLQTLADNEQLVTDKDDSLSFLPSFFGERHDTSIRGSLTNMNNINLSSIGHIFRHASEGVLCHLDRMVPADFLISQGVARLLVTGSVPVKNPIIRSKVEALYSEKGLDVVSIQGEEAVGSAIGASLIVKRQFTKKWIKNDIEW